MNKLEKSFLRYLDLFKRGHRQAKDLKQDRRLSQLEKIILENYFTLRDNKNQTVINALTAITVEANEHIQAHYH
jgi:hypothetical protein